MLAYGWQDIPAVTKSGPAAGQRKAG